MKITESNVSMSSVTTKTFGTRIAIKQGVVMIGEQPGGRLLAARGLTGKLSRDAFVELSDEAKKAVQDFRESQKEQGQGEVRQENNANVASKLGRIGRPNYSKFMEARRDYRFELLEKLMTMLLGRKYKIFEPKEIMINNGEGSNMPNFGQNGLIISGEAQGTAVAQLRFTSATIEHYESESVSFNAQASVKTEDGREVNIEIGLNMSRELYSKLEVNSLEIGVFCDPLVINFGTSMAQLSDHKISFDLDCDGKSDQISTLLSGSGFLAVDWNNDGAINDGSELFGAKSGNGFADLAKFDSDGNGWVDENDEIWDKLRIWTVNEDASSSLAALGEIGIGAIYLGSVGTDYTLANGDEVNGMLRRTGFFLFENGTAGTAQHIDLKI